ncbi:2-iminoacetate synthase ThiH [Desulfuribacillus alkaliarsenatis]|uniref:Thiamine biosynthesis protein ThiH n=1 Tax=Desulfuribacillus alkaliarsenatis TaxID=766136 RepID=A0A1E5G0B0_9FIRM|nr:2-iminoacetate synthase ThiH [Desulfuribacillus alkaliarsenatis]OEF96183.1 thiamine biosynthesis protein ThiH [Desulfuribacillus alkaliarsenatis]
MDFYRMSQQYDELNIERYLNSIDDQDVINAINKQHLNELDYLALLSPSADKYLEQMAKRARELTIQHFGRTIGLYTPLYLADYCVNQCAYCSFNSQQQFKRNKLTLQDLEKEAGAISKTGLKHILVLTGESRSKTPVSYIKECIVLLKKYFSSISIEIYPLDVEEYKELVDVGVDGLTIYQEVYNEEIYRQVHLKGPKKDYHYRLNAAERGCVAGMRSVNIGTLLGLGDFYSEAFYTGLHANYLQTKYIDVEVGVSLPRLRPFKGAFQPRTTVSDQQLVQMMLALRLYLPRVGINISTRETAKLRDAILPLGVTKMSAGVSTKVGGHSGNEEASNQFDISDERSVEEMMEMIYQNNYQPVLKDWHLFR